MRVKSNKTDPPSFDVSLIFLSVRLVNFRLCCTSRVNHLIDLSRWIILNEFKSNSCLGVSHLDCCLFRSQLLQMVDSTEVLVEDWDWHIYNQSRSWNIRSELGEQHTEIDFQVCIRSNAVL